MRILAVFSVVISSYGAEQSNAEDPLNKENDPTKVNNFIYFFFGNMQM